MNARSIREERRYRSAVNSGIDVKLARQLRGRSDQYIYETYGVRVSKKIPKLKPLSKETKYKKQLEIRKYRYSVERGIKPEIAITLKKSNFKYIEERVRYYTPKEPPKTVKISKVEMSRKDRIKQWGFWSMKENKERFPKDIKAEAQRINLSKGFDVNAKYGYTVLFYAYIERESTKKWLDLIKNDIVTEMAIYKTGMKLA